MSNGAELLSHALVREYLARRGYRKALAELDAARPPSAGDVTSRADITQSLRLEELLRASRTSRGSLSTLLEHVVDARLADCARRIRGSTDSESDDSESDRGRAGGGATEDDGDTNDSDSDEGGGRPTLAVSLPMGGPLERVRAPAASAASAASTASTARPASGRPASARPASGRPATARPSSAIGARTPNTVGGRAYGPVTVGELPSTSRARTLAVGAAGGGLADGQPGAAADGSAALAPKAISFTGRNSERLVVRPGEVNGGTVELEFLEGCEVLVLDWSAQVTVDACTSCKLLLGPVDGSVMLRECVGVSVAAVCRQLRCRDCDSCEMRLFTFGPIIESSQRMAFGAWNAAYPQLSRHFAAARLDPAAPNKWAEVHDFNDPGGCTNWRTLADDAGAAWIVDVVPGDIGGALFGRHENPVAARQAAAAAARPVAVAVDLAAAGARRCALRLQFRPAVTASARR